MGATLFNTITEIIDGLVSYIENWLSNKEALLAKSEDFLENNYLMIVVIFSSLITLFLIISELRKWAVHDVMEKWNKQENGKIDQYHIAVDQPLTKVKVRKERFRWDLPKEEAMERYNSPDNIIEKNREGDKT